MNFKSRLKITDQSGLVQQPHDPYWDAPITRREVQLAVNDLCVNEAELMARGDTAHIVLNLLCEKLNITRGEIDVFVARKKEEMREAKEAEEKSQNVEAQDGRSNP